MQNWIIRKYWYKQAYAKENCSRSEKFVVGVVRGRLFNFDRINVSKMDDLGCGVCVYKNNKIIGSVWDCWAELEPFLRQFSLIESTGTLVNWKLVFSDADFGIIIGIFIKMEGTLIPEQYAWIIYVFCKIPLYIYSKHDEYWRVEKK